MLIESLAEQEWWRLTPDTYWHHCTNGWWRRYDASVRLARYLQDEVMVADGRGLVAMPPRHTKSTTTAAAVAHYLDNNPTHRVAWVSYSREVAQRWGGYVRDHFEQCPDAWQCVHPKYAAVYDWRLCHESETARGTRREVYDDDEHDDDDVEFGERGGMRSVGFLGPLASYGFHGVVIDDPYRGLNEALSKSYRDKWWEFLTSTLWSRLEPGAWVLVMHHRWHSDDLIGRIQQEHNDAWSLFCVPAITLEPVDVERDSLGRGLGEVAIPERYDEAQVMQLFRGMLASVAEPLMLQRPRSVEGKLYRRDWWQYWDTPDRARQAGREALPKLDDMDEVVTSWDLAFKDHQTSSYVVGQVWARKGRRRYLLDQTRARLDYLATKRAILSMRTKWPTVRRWLIEDKANGSAILSDLAAQIPGMIAINPKGSKYARAVSCASEIERGDVYLPPPETYSWVPGFVERCGDFPDDGTPDDEVDAMTQVQIRWARSARGGRSYYKTLMG